MASYFSYEQENFNSGHTDSISTAVLPLYIELAGLQVSSS